MATATTIHSTGTITTTVVAAAVRTGPTDRIGQNAPTDRSGQIRLRQHFRRARPQQSHLRLDRRLTGHRDPVVVVVVAEDADDCGWDSALCVYWDRSVTIFKS